MAARTWIPLVLAVVIAAGCVRLGLWQLDRLEQRRDRNAVIERGFRAAPIEAEAAARASEQGQRFRRVVASGRWSYGKEFAIPGRTRSGSPGVHIVTPMALDGGDAEILVNRGWVYSPDARRVDLGQWREGERAELIGYVDELPQSVRGDTAALYIVALADSATATQPIASHPARLSPPPFGDEGPHLNYAVQWFSFAAIALVGTPLVVRRARRRRD
ncbi:MAG: SURF1 family protein [Gemmatimonadaceae bacterium]